MDPTNSTVADKRVPERGKWGKSIQSLLLCISMSVGLGNVWRFPTVAYFNGGGAFLIPYFVLLGIIGRPLYYLELILGQFSSLGPLKIWRMVPAFKGIGYAQMLSVAYVLIFYNYLMALSVFYIYSSFHECLPWTTCNYVNNSNATNQEAEYFWKYDVLEEDPNDPNTMKSISWKLVVCLFITWVLVYISVRRGTGSLGKMAYFTAIFPYLVLTALLVVSLQVEGSITGIKYFFEPKWSKLTDIKVWYNACEQSFFSLGIGYSNVIMIASYNKFTNNVHRDAIIISVLDTFTSIVAGCIVFAVLGTLAHTKGVDISHVVEDNDLGLAFIVYPQALANVKIVPQLWSVLFFIMLFTLGIGSSMTMLENILTGIKDKFPKLRDRNEVLALCICIMFFFMGLPLTTNVGHLILVMLNRFGVSAAIYIYAILTVIGVMWIYGARNFWFDVQFMTGSSPGIAWKVLWIFATPTALIVVFIYGNALQATSEVEKLPKWVEMAGWGLAAIAIAQIPIWSIIVVVRNKGKTCFDKIKCSFQPTQDWGPSHPDDKNRWIDCKQRSDAPNTDVAPVSAVFYTFIEQEIFSNQIDFNYFAMENSTNQTQDISHSRDIETHI